jgi:hypothetical protein
VVVVVAAEALLAEAEAEEGAAEACS